MNWIYINQKMTVNDLVQNDAALAGKLFHSRKYSYWTPAM